MRRSHTIPVPSKIRRFADVPDRLVGAKVFLGVTISPPPKDVRSLQGRVMAAKWRDDESVEVEIDWLKSHDADGVLGLKLLDDGLATLILDVRIKAKPKPDEHDAWVPEEILGMDVLAVARH